MREWGRRSETERRLDRQTETGRKKSFLERAFRGLVIRRNARKDFTRIFGSNDQTVGFYSKTLVDRHKIPKST